VFFLLLSNLRDLLYSLVEDNDLVQRVCELMGIPEVVRVCALQLIRYLRRIVCIAGDRLIQERDWGESTDSHSCNMCYSSKYSTFSLYRNLYSNVTLVLPLKVSGWVVLSERSVDVFRQCKQSLGNKGCSYRQFLCSMNLGRGSMNQSNNK